jgi:hypothetical protein
MEKKLQESLPGAFERGKKSDDAVVQQFVCKLVASGLFDFSTSVSC